MIPFPDKKYQIIHADPPWHFASSRGKDVQTYVSPDGCDRQRSNKTRPMPYPTMTVAEIKALPVATLAGENCDLYLWTTHKHLPDAFSVMHSWGFRYCQILTWCKAPRGTHQGGLFCPTTEFLLLGRKGKMPTDKVRKDSTWWQVKRPHNSHSTKPGFFRDLIEEMSDGPRIELFARQKTEGWDVWGNEV